MQCELQQAHVGPGSSLEAKAAPGLDEVWTASAETFSTSSEVVLKV